MWGLTFTAFQPWVLSGRRTSAWCWAGRGTWVRPASWSWECLWLWALRVNLEFMLKVFALDYFFINKTIPGFDLPFPWVLTWVLEQQQFCCLGATWSGWASRIISCPWHVILYRPSLSTLPRTVMVLLLKEIFENLFRSKWHWQLNRLWQWILLGSTTCPCPYPLSIWQPNLLKLHLSRRCWDYKWYNQF